MDFSKLKNKLLILLCVFVVLFPFWCVRGLCADTETVTGERINGVAIYPNNNYFVENNSTFVICFQIEKGYKYTLTNVAGVSRDIVFSHDLPSPNVVYDFIKSLPNGESYSFILDDNSYFYISGTSGSYQMTREKLSSMNGAVSDLVDNVGFDSIWNIFDISIKYILVVVVFAFGVFIIFKIIKMNSKGKQGF